MDDVDGHGMKNQPSQTISRLSIFAHSDHDLVKARGFSKLFRLLSELKEAHLKPEAAVDFRDYTPGKKFGQ